MVAHLDRTAQAMDIDPKIISTFWKQAFDTWDFIQYLVAKTSPLVEDLHPPVDIRGISIPSGYPILSEGIRRTNIIEGSNL